MKVFISSISHNSVNAGCFFHLLDPIMEKAPISLGTAVTSLQIEPHFDDVANVIPGGDEMFQWHQENLRKLPSFKFSRTNKTITIKYWSKVCLGVELAQKASPRAGEFPNENESANVLRAFFVELIDVLRGLSKVVKKSDDFNVPAYLAWLTDRIADLPSDNGAVFERWNLLMSSSVAKSNEPDLSDISAMSIDEFWKIIALVDQDALAHEDEQTAVTPVTARLAKLTVPKIKSFYNHLTNALYELDTREHFDAAPSFQTDDSFLYLRCFIVGKGRKYYEAVLKNPAKIGDADCSFEFLLSAASDAWAQVTDDDPLNFDTNCTEQSFESGSNRLAWGQKPGAIESITVEDTRQSIEAMLNADRTQSASVASQSDRSAFLDKLDEFGFTTPGYRYVEIRLMPTSPHGELKHIAGAPTEARIEFEGGFEAVKFVALTPQERRTFFINLCASALSYLADLDGSDKSIIERARNAAISD